MIKAPVKIITFILAFAVGIASAISYARYQESSVPLLRLTPPDKSPARRWAEPTKFECSIGCRKLYEMADGTKAREGISCSESPGENRFHLSMSLIPAGAVDEDCAPPNPSHRENDRGVYAYPLNEDGTRIFKIIHSDWGVKSRCYYYITANSVDNALEIESRNSWMFRMYHSELSHRSRKQTAR